MRIVGGRLKGHRLRAPRGQEIRPTTDRVREALFSMLEHRGAVAGARVLDAFAGTGALGLEALSRGAEQATFLDSRPASLACLRENVAALGEETRATILRRDATKPGPATAPHDLVFLDAPYGRGLGPRALAALDMGGWIAAAATIVIEAAADERIALPEPFAEVLTRRHGGTRLIFAARPVAHP